MTELYHDTSIPLMHNGECSLFAIAPDLTIFAEELHDDFVIQHHLTPDGSILQTVDERAGDFFPLRPPPGSITPPPARHTQQLNFVGARHRGMRDDERIHDLVRPFTVQTKMALGKRLGIMPPLILGLSESYVLTEAPLHDEWIVCRRIRIAYALERPRTDEAGQTYDYDSVQMHIAHRYNPLTQETLSPDEAFAGLPGVDLNRPTDCITTQNHLFIADSGNPNAIHIWTF